MIRLLGLLGLVALVVAVPMTHDIFAAQPAKVSICHVNSSNSAGGSHTEYGYSYDYTALPPLDEDYYDYRDYAYGYEYIYTYHLGRVIEVSENAVDAHVAHGDATTFTELTDSWADYISSIEDGDYDYGYSTTYTYSTYTYDYDYVNRRVGTNAVVKNANCTWTTYEFNYTN